VFKSFWNHVYWDFALAGSGDSNVVEFLSVLKRGTCNVYGRGLIALWYGLQNRGYPPKMRAQVDPLYIEYWMGHKIPEQLRAYINKSRESCRQTYSQQAEPHLKPPQYKNPII
jgi:hypothetical protein